MKQSNLPMLFASAALLLGGCSEQRAEHAAATADEVAVSPNIPTAIAPGVAFSFDYSFTLPAKAISQVQEQHARACQRLGPKQCRVSGLQYEQPDADRVSAQLDLLLAPDVAHAFGNEAIGAVREAGGELDRAEVRGENAGEKIRLSQSDSAGISAEVERIEARLTAKGLLAGERNQLQAQLSDLRERLRGQSAERSTLETAIASTPVTLTYSSEGVLGSKGAFGKAGSASLASMASLAALVLYFGGMILPWLVVGGGLLFAWRAMRKRFVRTPAPTVVP